MQKPRKKGEIMKIYGLQKLTLLDFPGKTACTVFTAGCQLRCPFCHNAALAFGDPGAPMDEEEFFAFLSKRQGLLEGVCVTGGEPLLSADLPAFLARVHSLGFLTKLDTNGFSPDRLAALLEQGLVDYVAMDIKSSPQGYAKACGLSKVDMQPIRNSIDLLRDGGIEYEFRTTVVRGIHTKESLVELARWIGGAREYYLQQFKDSGNLIAPDGLGAFDEQELLDFAEAIRPFVPAVQVRGITTR